MERMRSTADQTYTSAARSDATLLAGVRRREQRSLAKLYDRYAPLVYTLARSVHPEMAETITERVFYELWSSRGAATQSGSLLHTLIHLTQVAALEDSMSRRRHERGAEPPFKVLAPFEGLAPAVYEVMVLTYVGQLDVHELATALNIDKARVREALATGIRMLTESIRPRS